MPQEDRPEGKNIMCMILSQGVSSLSDCKLCSWFIKWDKRCFKGKRLANCHKHMLCTLNISELPKEQEESNPPSSCHHHLWWEKKRHCAEDGLWMWIIEQCPTAVCLSIHITGTFCKKDNKAERTWTNSCLLCGCSITVSIQLFTHIYSLEFGDFGSTIMLAEGVEWSSSKLKVGQFDPQSSQKTICMPKCPWARCWTPELCLIERQSAANRFTVWMCVTGWM